jgi:hypothetical protein
MGAFKEKLARKRNKFDTKSFKDMARTMEAVDRQSRKMEGNYGNNKEVNKVSVRIYD